MKDPRKASSLLSHICEVQRQGGRKFVATMSIQAPQWVRGTWKDAKDKSEVRHLGVHPTGSKGIQVITNSVSVIDALLERPTEDKPCRFHHDANSRNLCSVIDEKVKKGVEVDVLMNANANEDPEAPYGAPGQDSLHSDDNAGIYIDDTTGLELDAKETATARRLEMKTFSDMKVYDYVPREIAITDKRGKIVGVRWVDTQKGPIVRSRLVAQEFASKDDREDIFAATPPLFATELVISDAASQGDLWSG